MERKEGESPLKSILSYPPRRSTPAVPTPDWQNLSSPGKPPHTPVPAHIPSPVIVRATPSPLIIQDGSGTPRQSYASLNSPSTSRGLNLVRSGSISSIRSVDGSSNEIRSTIIRTWESSSSNESLKHENIDKLPPTPSRISGDISFTPTHSAFTPHSVQNPHATIVAHTPIASGPEQARSSIKLQNCVSTVNLSCELKLLDIYCRTRYSEYNPSRFHGVVMRIFEPRATALVFRSGKLVCTGAKNEHDSLLAARKFAKIIHKLGYPVRFTEFKIQNFVATADLRFPIRLEALQQSHGQFTSYEPELFPGLIYRLVRPRVVLLIFVNGKIVFTGGKSRNDITESLNIIYPILRSFKKN